MSEIIQGGRGDLVPLPVGVPRRLPREARERITDEVVEGYVSAARAQAAGWVASVGLNQIAMVAGLEARQTASDPMRAELYAAIVDDMALVVRQSVRRLGARP
ncbi:hypothetical protein [Amycolatopsis sp. CA-126428]|uniref:hypothetical protein n=1 Tax=Amycolatopsis sp. CA-126428 TaxID=2073158 RepID=UPI000CD100A0|nr:hypothetical protein [Amycolatopsis sp. CA-126428]